MAKAQFHRNQPGERRAAALAWTFKPNRLQVHVHRSLITIILVANEASTDIGVIGFTKQDQSWKSWTLNEGAGIALPIINSQDTFPKQIWLSFDSKVSIAGVTLDSPKIPPSPIFNIELDNGEVLGYYCIRTGLDDNDLYFSKMISNSEKFESAEKEEVREERESGRPV